MYQICFEDKNWLQVVGELVPIFETSTSKETSS